MKKIILLTLYVLLSGALPCHLFAAEDLGHPSSTTAGGDGELNFTLPCVAFGNGYFSVELDRKNDSAAPFGVDWQLRAVASGQAASNCATLDPSNLNISIPYIEIVGTSLWVALGYYNNPADASGYYWVFKDADIAYTPEGTESTATVLLLENKNADSDVAGILSTDQGDMVFLKDLDSATQKEYIKSIAMLRKNEVVSTFTFDAQGGLLTAGNSTMAKKILNAASSRMAVMESSASSATDTLGMISSALSILLASLGDTPVYPGYASLNTIVSGALNHYIAGEASTIEHYQIDKNLTCVSDLAACAKNVDTSFKAAVAGENPPDVPDSEKFTKDEVSPGEPPAVVGFYTCGTFLFEVTQSCNGSTPATFSCVVMLSEGIGTVICNEYSWMISSAGECYTIPIGTGGAGVWGDMAWVATESSYTISGSGGGCQDRWSLIRQ